MTITHEQPGSLIYTLTEAGHQHGDEQFIRLVVGNDPAVRNFEHPHLAFCSAEAQMGPIHRMATWRERLKPIQGELILVGDMQAMAAAIGLERCMTEFVGTIRTNGNIYLTPRQIIRHPANSYARNLRNPIGCGRAREILANASV